MIQFKFKILLMMMVCFMLTLQVSASEEAFRKKVEQNWKEVTNVEYNKPQLIEETIDNADSFKKAFKSVQTAMFSSVFKAHNELTEDTQALMKQLGLQDPIKFPNENEESEKKFLEEVKRQTTSDGKETDNVLENIVKQVSDDSYTDEKLAKVFSNMQEIILKSAFQVHSELIKAMKSIVNPYEDYATDLRNKLPNEVIPGGISPPWSACFQNGGQKVRDEIIKHAWDLHKKEIQETDTQKELDQIAKDFWLALEIEKTVDRENKFKNEIKKQWTEVQSVKLINYEITNLAASFDIKKDNYLPAYQEVREIALKSAFKAHQQTHKTNKEKLENLKKMINSNANVEGTENLQKDIEKLQGDLQHSKKEYNELQKVLKEHIPIKNIDNLIKSIKKSNKGKVVNTDSDKNILEAVRAIDDLLERNLKASQNFKGDKAIDLIKKLAASIENEETVDSGEFEINKDAGKINNAIKDFQKHKDAIKDLQKHKDAIKDLQKYKDAINSLKEIAEGKNDEKKDVALKEAKPIATEMETLRTSEKCYRTTTIILIVSIAIGVLAYLFMQYVSNEPEEKTEDQSDEQSYDKANKKTAKQTDKKMVKKIDEKSAEKVERAVQNIDEKAIDKVNEENQKVPAQVSKEIQDTNNLATNEAEKGHVLIDVKE